MKRHDPKLNEKRIKKVIDEYREDIAYVVTKNEMSVTLLAGMVHNGADLAQCVAAIDSNDKQIITGLSAAARGGAAIFTALGAENTQDILLQDNKVRQVSALAPSSETTPKVWMQAFYSGMCIGDVYALDRLAGADVALIRKSSTIIDEFSYLHIDALCGYHHRDADTPERLLAALKATDPEAIDPRMVDYVLNITVPQMELLFRIIKKDAASFNRTMEKALELHKKYYTRFEAPVLGELALGPLALACAAHDAGLSVTIKSDYIPNWLIEYERTDLKNR